MVDIMRGNMIEEIHVRGILKYVSEMQYLGSITHKLCF
jgi:hypothetical protein